MPPCGYLVLDWLIFRFRLHASRGFVIPFYDVVSSSRQLRLFPRVLAVKTDDSYMHDSASMSFMSSFPRGSNHALYVHVVFGTLIYAKRITCRLDMF